MTARIIWNPIDPRSKRPFPYPYPYPGRIWARY